jgi:hypothetical protein
MSQLTSFYGSALKITCFTAFSDNCEMQDTRAKVGSKFSGVGYTDCFLSQLALRAYVGFLLFPRYKL